MANAFSNNRRGSRNFEFAVASEGNKFWYIFTNIINFFYWSFELFMFEKCISLVVKIIVLSINKEFFCYFDIVFCLIIQLGNHQIKTLSLLPLGGIIMIFLPNQWVLSFFIDNCTFLLLRDFEFLTVLWFFLVKFMSFFNPPSICSYFYFDVL